MILLKELLEINWNSAEQILVYSALL